MWIKRLIIILTVIGLSTAVNFTIFAELSTNTVQTNSIILALVGLVLILVGRHLNKASSDKLDNSPAT